MSKEWQEASNEYALVRIISALWRRFLSFVMVVNYIEQSLTDLLSQQREKMNPIYGISSEGYEGKGFVQSPPLEKS